MTGYYNQDAQAYMNSEGGLGSLGDYGSNGDFSVSSLPGVSDPDKTYADITRREYEDYINNYRQFELDLIDQAQNDTSLIDQAREDSVNAAGITSGIAERNLQRYGANVTPAQQQEMSRSLQRSNTLGGIQSVNDARIAQREANTAILSDLINIGQGVNRSSQGQLGTSAANAAARQQAYESARAASKAQTYSTIGSLGSMAIMALAI
jgi:hypothetical protein